MERPLHAILLEEREKLFFHDLIQHITSKGFKERQQFGVEDGRWTERLLHYRYHLPHGYTEIEVSTERKMAYLTLFEFAAAGAINNIHYLDYKFKDYSTRKVLEDLDTKCQLVELL